jgi:prolyl-tRNA synthetase
LREEPADAEALSHKLMLRAGLVRQLGAGIYVYLPVGQRVMDRITAIVREEMNAIGGQEITMPVIQPAEIWQKSGRWDGIPEMFKLKDRWGRDMVLGMTHEEVIAWLAAREIRSYRDLPQIWYQIQTKERDEARPRSGVLRTREFVMKDSYTLDPDVAALDRSYAAHEGAYRRIFERCGLRFYVAHSDTGMMGGLGAQEFLAPCAAGEDEIALCGGCGYAANVEIARGVPAPPAFPDGGREEVATPNVKTIAQVSEFLKRRRRGSCWRSCAATTRSTSESWRAPWARSSAPPIPRRSRSSWAPRWGRWDRSAPGCRSSRTRRCGRAATSWVPTARASTSAAWCPGATSRRASPTCTP